MKMLMLGSFFLSMMMIFLSHPISMIIVISSQSLILSLIMVFLHSTPWFALIVFLIFMGGLMVLFVYVTSLASNEDFNKLNKTWAWIIVCSMAMGILLILMVKPLINTNSSLNIKPLVIKIYSMSSFNFSMLLMVYLLFVLIVAATLINRQEGPLRSVTY